MQHPRGVGVGDARAARLVSLTDSGPPTQPLLPLARVACRAPASVSRSARLTQHGQGASQLRAFTLQSQRSLPCEERFGIRSHAERILLERFHSELIFRQTSWKASTSSPMPSGRAISGRPPRAQVLSLSPGLRPKHVTWAWCWWYAASLRLWPGGYAKELPLAFTSQACWADKNVLSHSRRCGEGLQKMARSHSSCMPSACNTAVLRILTHVTRCLCPTPTYPRPPDCPLGLPSSQRRWTGKARRGGGAHAPREGSEQGSASRHSPPAGSALST